MGRTAMMTMIIVAVAAAMLWRAMRRKALFAMEDKKIYAKGIKRSHQYANQGCVIGKPSAPHIRRASRFNNVFLRVVT